MEGVDNLAHERQKAQFDVEEMKVVWAGSRHTLEVSDRMSRLVASDPVGVPPSLPLSISFLSSGLLAVISEELLSGELVGSLWL